MNRLLTSANLPASTQYGVQNKTASHTREAVLSHHFMKQEVRNHVSRHTGTAGPGQGAGPANLSAAV